MKHQIKSVILLSAYACFTVGCAGDESSSKNGASGSAGMSGSEQKESLPTKSRGGSGSSGESSISQDGGKAGEAGSSEVAGGGNDSSNGGRSVAGETSVAGSEDSGVGGKAGVGGRTGRGSGGTATSGGAGVGGRTTIESGGETGSGGLIGVGGRMIAHGGRSVAGESGVAGFGDVGASGSTERICAEDGESCEELACCDGSADADGNYLICTEEARCAFDTDIPSGIGGTTGVGGMTGFGGATSSGGTTGVGGTISGSGGVYAGSGGHHIHVGSGGSGTGGDVAIGGSSVTGGTTSAGGTSATGGSDAGVGGTGIGGLGIGGIDAGIGGSNVGGSSAACVPIPLAGPSDAIATPFSCSDPVRDTAFDSFQNSEWMEPKDVLLLEGGGLFVTIGNSYVTTVYYNPSTSTWSDIGPSANNLDVVTGSAEKGIWIGGSSSEYKALAMRLENGVWVDHSAGLLEDFSVEDIYVVSQDEAYAVLQGVIDIVDQNGEPIDREYHSYIYRWNGSVWGDMVAPRANGELYLDSILGDGSSSFVVTGGPDILRYNGCDWTDYSGNFPVDGYIESLAGNADGEYYLGGAYSESGGFVLVTTDFVTWVKYDLPDIRSADIIESPRVGASFVGGYTTEFVTGVFSVESQGVLSGLIPFNGTVNFPMSISSSGNDIVIGTQGSQVGVYRATCQ